MAVSRIKDKRFCRICDSDKTWFRVAKNKPSYPQWHRDGLGTWICKQCYNRLITLPLDKLRYPERLKKYNRISPKLHIRYKPKNKDINVGYMPRLGICSKCHQYRATVMHHYQYIDTNPLAMTIELCRSCHCKAHGRKDGRFC